MAIRSKHPQLNKTALSAIQRLVERLIAGHQATIDRYEAIPRTKREDWTDGQIVYCRHAIAALKHLLSIAKQSAGTRTNAQNP